MSLLRLVSSFCIGIMLYTSPAFAGAEVVDVTVSNQYGKALVSARLEDAFSDTIKEALLSGMTVTISYHLNLRESRSFMWDRTEKEIRLHKMVKYDSFNKEFNAIEVFADEVPNSEFFEHELASIKKKNIATLFDDGKQNSTSSRYLVMRELHSVLGWLGSIKNIFLADNLGVEGGSKYYVEVMAEMDSGEFGSAARYILFFVSFMDFETEWETSTAFMLKQAAPVSGVADNSRR